jgi:hypothetical protein
VRGFVTALLDQPSVLPGSCKSRSDQLTPVIMPIIEIPHYHHHHPLISFPVHPLVPLVVKEPQTHSNPLHPSETHNPKYIPWSSSHPAWPSYPLLDGGWDLQKSLYGSLQICADGVSCDRVSHHGPFKRDDVRLSRIWRLY